MRQSLVLSIAFLAILATGGVSAQEAARETRIDLAGVWSVRVGREASPGTPRAVQVGWRDVSLPDTWKALGLEGVQGPLSFRRRVVIPARLRQAAAAGDLGVLVGPVRFGGVRVFVDSTLIGSYGDSSGRVLVPRAQVFPLPPEVMSSDSTWYVWVEVNREAWVSDGFASDSLVLSRTVVGYLAELTEFSELEWMRWLHGDWLALILATLFGYVAVQHFVMYWRTWHEVSYLWFGVVGACYTVNTLVSSAWFFEITPDLGLSQRLMDCSLHLLVAAGMQFFWTFFGRVMGKPLRALQLLHVAVAGGVLVVPSLALETASLPARLILISPALVATMALVFQMARGSRDAAARIVGVGAGIALTIEAFFTAAALFGHYPRQEAPGVAFAVLLVAMVLALSSRFHDVLAHGRETQRAYQELLASTTDLMQSVRADGSFAFVNRAWLDAMGYAWEDLQALRLLDVVDPTSKECCSAALRDLAAGLCVAGLEMTFVTKGGQPLRVRGNCAPLMQEGRFESTHWTFDDVTSQVRTELDLARSEAASHALLEAIPDLVFRMSSTGQFIDFRAPDPELLFTPPESFIGRGVAEVMPPEFSEVCLERIRLANETGEVQQWEYDLSLSDGRRTFDARLKTISGGEVVAIVRDVTTERRREAELRLGQRFEMIGRVAGGVAHDFNNLLTSVVGFVDLAMETGHLEPDVRGYLERVATAGERGRVLVAQMLTFTRETEAIRRPVLVQSVLLEVIDLARPSIPARIEIVLDIDESCRPVSADPTQIHQLLMNLSQNAAAAMAVGGGTLEVCLAERVATGPFTLGRSELEGTRCVWLSVRDTGQGIDEKTMEALFDPFFTTKPPGLGTGLGLAVVHKIVLAHEGCLRVTSDPHQGACFEIYLPLDQRAAASSDKSGEMVPPTVGGGRGRILVVENEDLVARLVVTSLVQCGYDVTAFSSSIEALAAFTGTPLVFDLIVTDLTMSNMDGIELAKRARSVRPNLPVILMSGAETLPEPDVLALAVDAFVRKPFRVSEFVAVVVGLLEGAGPSS